MLTCWCCCVSVSVYSTEGAATVVPDRVTGIFMAAYQQLQAPQHKLHFFKLLVTEFGVQREQLMVLLEQNTVMLGGDFGAGRVRWGGLIGLVEPLVRHSLAHCAGCS